MILTSFSCADCFLVHFDRSQLTDYPNHDNEDATKSDNRAFRELTDHERTPTPSRALTSPHPRPPRGGRARPPVVITRRKNRYNVWQR